MRPRQPRFSKVLGFGFARAGGARKFWEVLGGFGFRFWSGFATNEGFEVLTDLRRREKSVPGARSRRAPPASYREGAQMYFTLFFFSAPMAREKLGKHSGFARSILAVLGFGARRGGFRGFGRFWVPVLRVQSRYVRY